MKLLGPHNGELDGALSEYKYFINQHSHIVDIKLLRPMLSYWYLGFGDYTSFWIDKDFLHCETISKFRIIFPLQK